jgi:hypothetical protein
MSLPDYTAKIIIPTAVTDAALKSCTVAEPASGETAWNAATAYTVGQEAIRATLHKKYRRLVAGTTATAPESDATNWLDIGATNRWAQFDDKIGTRTSVASGNLTTVLELGSLEGLALMDLRGESVTATLKQTPGGAVAWTRTQSLDDTPVTSVFDWMYGEYRQLYNVLWTDLPGQFPNGELTVTVTANATGAAIGALVAGRVHTLGLTEYGAGSGLLNWGKVIDDGFGNREWSEGGYANRVTLPLVFEASDMTRIKRTLTSVRSTPCVYVATSLNTYDTLNCYGVFRDLYITVPHYGMVTCNLEIDGLNED